MEKNIIQNKHDYEIIFNSNLFDFLWFKKIYDVNDDLDLIWYYIENFEKKSLNPTPFFDSLWYLEKYPDVKKSGNNPFSHFIKYGIKEKRSCNEIMFNYENKDDYFFILESNLFSWGWYDEHYVNENCIDPIIHYLEYGFKSGFVPNPIFNNKDNFLKNSEDNPLIDYIKNNFSDNDFHIFSFDEVPFLNLKKCIKGKEGYLFLINDGNSEIKQHFDKNYVNKFNSKKFLEDYFFKKKLFNKYGISYFYFIVQDKSVVCKDLLPFDNNFTKRNIDDLVNIIPDFSESLSKESYFKYDSHLNFDGGKVLSFNILNYMDNNFLFRDFKNFFDDCNLIEFKEHSDLLSDLNYSYSIDEKNSIALKTLKRKVPNVSNLNIPNEFLECNGRKSFYLKNDNSFSNSRALIFRDSSFEQLMDYFTFYFDEMFAYWDHLSLNNDLIRWYNPDIIIEIRIERFIENYSDPLWVNDKQDIFKIE